jgi:hypothetical protein
MSWANHFAYCLDSAAWIVAGMDEVILAPTFFWIFELILILMRYCFPATFVAISFSNKEINDRILMGLNLKLPHNEEVNTSIITPTSNIFCHNMCKNFANKA